MPSSSANRAGGSSHRSAFDSAEYRRYFPSAVFSTLGSWLLRFLLGWSAWDLTESATWVGVVAGLLLAPALLLSPLFGIVSDRINPRNGLLLTITIHAAFSAIAGIAVFMDVFTLPILLILAAGLGVATSAHTPIRLALVPSLVPRQALPSAIGYSAIMFNTSRILGPALGAWLLKVSTAGVAYGGAALLMLGSLPFLLFIAGRQRDHASGKGTGFRAQLRDGLRYTRQHRAIRLVFGFTLVNALLGRSVIELLPALSGVLLQGDAATLATLTASAGVGSIVGGLVVSRQGGGETRLFSLMTISLATAALLVAGLGWAGEMQLFTGLIGFLSMLTTMVGTGSQALAQLLVDDSYRGRVLSLWTMLAMGAPAAGAMVMGALADVLSFPSVLLGFALIALISIGRLHLTNRAEREPT